MGKRRKRNPDTANAMSRIDKNIEIIAKNTDETNRNTAELAKNSKSKLPIIISIIALIVTINGVFCLGDHRKIGRKSSTI